MSLRSNGAAFFALWFAFIFTAIGSIFIYLLLKDTSLHWGSFLFLLVVTLGLIGLSLISWIITLTFFFSKESLVSEQPKVVLTTLWTMEIMREELGDFYDIPRKPFSEIEVLMPWSWVAFDNRQGADSTGAIGLIEAAIWNLFVLNAVEMKIRHETISYFFNRFKFFSGERIYFKYVEASQEMSQGAWEKRLFNAIKNHTDKKLGMKTSEWVMTAFGPSSANPMRMALKFTEDEFIKKKWGKRSGVILKEFHWEVDPVRVSKWPVVRSYIGSYDKVESLLKYEIELALKNSEDTG